MRFFRTRDFVPAPPVNLASLAGCRLLTSCPGQGPWHLPRTEEDASTGVNHRFKPFDAQYTCDGDLVMSSAEHRRPKSHKSLFYNQSNGQVILAT